ncbi:cupredoxin domain-containing protein [Arthrobacter sp. UYEF3]|uniref:cupredoxin domain-containing protein n=1 Tax=Arthrobacter sp. UYEF3 TaxID=1756365 RepID=UPI003394EE9F
MKTGNTRVTLLLAAVLLGAAGCAAGGGTAASTTATAPPASASATASMDMGSGAPGTMSSGSAAAGSAASSTAAITISGFAYGAPLVVPAGATVTVTNMDSAEHTVTADTGSAFDVEVKGSGGTATFTAPSAPGTYAFHCTYHSKMHGTLTVK